MMSPIEAPPDDVQVAAVPEDDEVDRGQQQAPRRPEEQLAPLGEQLLAQHGVAAEHVLAQLSQLPPERPHDAYPREGFADAAVDLLPASFSHRPVDRAGRASRR
jgi:hypothetical protein